MRFSYAGTEGTGVLSTRHPTTVVDSSFATHLDREGRMRLGTEHVATINPAVDDLEGIADAILGTDVFADRILSLDFRAGLATIHTKLDPMTDGSFHRWTDSPAVPIAVDGRRMTALVDTSSPDTLTLPGGSAIRRQAEVTLAGRTQTVDVAVDPRVSEPRIGTRLLADYLIQIDFRNKTVSLWNE